MRDFSIISARVLLKVHSVAPIRGFLPVSVVVLGEKLNQTLEVFYNEIKVQEFVISSSTRLIVRVPDSQVGKELKGIQVFSSASVTRASALLSLELDKPMKTVDGMDRLVQAWVMIFYTTPGSDIFNQGSGGGVKTIIGKNTNHLGDGVSADLAMAIDRTKTELMRIQAKTSNIPLDEKLLSATLDAIRFDDKTTALTATVSLKNMLGDQAEISVG